MQWGLATTDHLDSGSLKALFEDEIGALRIPGFLSPAVAAAAAGAVRRRGVDFYRDVDPPIGRVGVTQFEYQHGERERQEYFGLAVRADAERRAMFAEDGDLLHTMIDALAGAWPAEVAVAVEPDGRRYFAGLVRVIGEGLLHCDWAPRDAPGWAIGAVDAQLTWNLYCQLPEDGGATVVYRRRWEPPAEQYALPGSYGYADELVDACPHVRLEPVTGDLVLFNSRNFHRIERGQGGPRISVSSFVGRLPDGRLVLWS